MRTALAARSEPVLILNAEDFRVRALGSSAAHALTELVDVLTADTILFWEEVQHLRDAPLFLKGLVDLEPKRVIVATGSASFALHSGTRESLAGRARRSRLLPFGLDEVAAGLPAGLVPAVRDARLLESWQRLLVTGGYPDVWLATEPRELLYELLEAFVLKDASDLHSIELPSVFRRLMELAAADVGNLVNLTNWAATAQCSSSTVSRYLEIAEQAHVLRRVEPFVGGKRAELTGVPKVYFLDNGLRNTLFGGFAAIDRRGDRGALWESGVYGELLKRLPLLDEVRYWLSKNGAEVDFVVRRRDRLVAIEVKASALPRPTLSRAARSFMDAYRPACLGVINQSLRLDTVEDGVAVLFRRPWELDELIAALE